MLECRPIVATVLLLVVMAATASPHHEGSGEVTSPEVTALRAISHSNLDFTKELYKVMSRGEGNVFFSPFSIQIILALAAQGARGTTEQQMVAGLKLPQDQQTTRDGFRQLVTSLNGDNSVTLKAANKIYTSKQYTTKEEFGRIATNDFFSDSQSLNFLGDPDGSRVTINSWVEENTAHKIIEMLKSGTITSSTAMVLVNAVYFKGDWDTKFDPRNTVNRPFYVTPEVTKVIPMMQLTGNGIFGFKVSSELNAHILEIPYAGRKMSLFLILPTQTDGLSDVETRIAQLNISDIVSQGFTRPRVHLSLPKFKLEQQYELTGVLREMGMTHMFSGNADFSGLLTEGGPIQVSAVAHKAFIELSEEGTVAAAATAVVNILRTNSSPPPVVFNANHPFIFMLAHTETDPANHSRESTAVLFMGRFSNP